MIHIEELLSSSRNLRRFAASPEMDPLTEDDALQEAQLLDIRFDATQATLGLLFELRVALQLREANTGVLIAHGVRALSWLASPRSTSRMAWNVITSTPRCADRLFELSLLMAPRAKLDLTAESAAFFVGHVPGLERMPDYDEDDEATIRAQTAGWQSDFSPVHAVFLDAAPVA